MTVKLSPQPRQQYLAANGALLSGGKLFTYVASSTTKQATYMTSVGDVANTNPIILDASGRTPSGVWLTTGLNYKIVLSASTDTDPPTSPIFTEDNIYGINDVSIGLSQWVSAGLTPTYISTTQFTLVGDQTTNFHVGRRVQLLVTAGTVYGVITVSAYTTLTTITVALDSGVLDSGLNSAAYGMLTTINPSISASSVANTPAGNIGSNTVQAALNELDVEKALLAGSATQAFSVSTLTSAVATGTAPLVVTSTTPVANLSIGGNAATANYLNNTAALKLPSITVTMATGALTFSAASRYLDFGKATLTDGTNDTLLAAPANLVLPSGGTLGTPTTLTARIVVIEMNIAGVAELAVVNLAGGNDLSEAGVISTTAISAASTANNVFYSTTARTGVAYRIVGIVDAVNTTGAWAAPTLVRGAGGNVVVQAQQILHVRDEKTAATSGGSSVAGNQIRTLNTVVANTIPGASLATDQITLPAGVYKIFATTPGYGINRHRARLVNVTDAVVTMLGSDAYSGSTSSVSNISTILGVFALNATKVINITHYTEIAVLTNGLGVSVSDTFISVYTSVIITKIG